MPNGPDVLPTTARPVPARGIARLDPAAFGPDVPAGTRVSPDGAAVEFRTAAAAVLPPVTLAAVERLPTDAGERLRLTLDLHRPHPELRLPTRVDADDPGRGLRLFVGRPDVYRALTRAPVAVEVVVGGAIVRVCDGGVRPAGFDAVEAVLPVDPREPEPVRLLAEWAVCPEKFLFVDVVGPDASLLAGPTVHVDLLLDGASAAVLGEGVPPLQLHCVPVVNRRVVELPPVPLHRTGAVQLDVDPLGENPPRVVMEVLRARAVRAGRTVATYAERLAPLPPPLAVQRVGTWSLERRGEQAWLSLADRGAAVGGRSLLVTAACCRRALPEGRPALATGAAWVGPLRPPLWPSAVAAAARPAGDLLAVVAPAFGRPDVAGFVRRCDAAPVAVDLPAGRAHGIEWRLTVDPGGLSPDDVYLLVRVLDHAFATAGPVDGFTRVTAVTIAGDGVAECPPRAGKGALPGPVVPGPSVVPPNRASAPPGATVATRSGRQAAAVARVFAAVTRPTSVTALGALLRYLLDVPVRVLPFQAARAEVEASARFRLGRGGRVLGRRQACWGVRVVLGPLDRRTFDRFGPGTRASRRVRLLIVGAVGAACPVEVEPVLRADLATPWQLGHGRLGRSLRLGGGAVS